jgi:Putative DNA-binding domain
VADPAALAALQRQFFALVAAREEVPEALVRLGLDARVVEAMVAGDARLDAIGRVGIYNDMYFFRLLGVIADDFPALARVLGRRDFRALIADYLEAFPPRDYSLRDLGRALPGFVAGHSLALVRPWLPDLAALEWARADLFDRVDAAPLATADLAEIAPEAFATLPLLAVPASGIVDVGYAVDEIWRACNRAADADTSEAAEEAATDEDAPLVIAPPRAERVRFCVWRSGGDIFHRRASDLEAPLLPALAAGTSFGALCEVIGQGRTPEEAAPLAFKLLVSWLKRGLVRRDAAPSSCP